MNAHSKLEKWIETGYELFAQEGHEGIQVERLARILNLNKSGFYHYFGDMENFSKQLIDHHYQMFKLFLDEVTTCQNVDPDYLNVLVKHKLTVMGQMQLVRNKNNPLYLGANKEFDEKIIRISEQIWASHLGIHNNPELVNQYHSQVRDMFYSRITWGNFNYDYLQILSNEARDIAEKMLNTSAPVAKSLGSPQRDLSNRIKKL